MNWQQTYLKQELWLTDAYLITPYITKALPTIGATKKCKSCNKIKFSSDFAHCELFVDRALPVCTKCLHKRKKNTAVAILNDVGFTKQCNKCGEAKLLGSFRVNTGQYVDNVLHKVCRQCSTAFKQRI